MKLHFKLFPVIIVTLLFVSCVKNKPFLSSYSVPPVFNQESNDSSALARVIMTYGMANYLSKSVSGPIDITVIDSLWLNHGRPFTREMVPDFVYSDTLLNNMARRVSIATNTSDADSLKSLADSVAILSRFYGTTASNGVAGVRTQSTPVSVKRLFNESGVEIQEVWFNTMLGANFMRNAFSNLSGPGQSVVQAWDLAYNYMGFPSGYEPNRDYNEGTVPRNRPLGIAALFAGVKNLDAGAKIYEEFRRARASAIAGDIRVNAISVATIKGYTEVTLVQSSLFALDSARQIADPVAKLHYLSKAHGLIIALKYRESTALSTEAYLRIREIMKTNFYTLTQDTSYEGINEIADLLINAYSSE
ncbi:hypothetical protein U0035_07995 [Niabella yanshanensis]|uniref:DUF4856 domain-containing protein n=1 Tax=Niabella yanshanensis TaxID=577386 RepID=A0ABZ0W9W0_9BACT|nr:hypothetical protein [Niabella yanshanensis]WQD40085.1 hypothetical protein U0035_07995 [Niabella yanshanensis]